MVTDNFKELIEIMEGELALYRELRELELRKKDCIINNDVKALDAITREEQGFVKTIVQLESLRSGAVDGLCRKKGCDLVDNLQQLYRILDLPQRRQLEAQEAQLLAAIGDVQATNRLNEQLIQQSLEYIDVTLAITQQLGTTDAGYGSEAKEREVKRSRGIFDAKV